MTTPTDIAAYQLSPDERCELEVLCRGLRTNERLRHKKTAIDGLIAKGLAQSSGLAVRITPLGYEVLAVL